MQMKDRRSQLRGEIKSKAQSVVDSNYLLSSLSPDKIRVLIKMLKTKSAFTFLDPEKVHLSISSLQ